MAESTVSERAFKAYLDKRGIVARYEELPSGITQRVDYSFELAGQTIRLDVKEWKPKRPHLGVSSFDPYEPIRNKIAEGRKKFKQYKGRGEPCVLVLCHYGPQFIILDPISIFGAMLGDLGWVFPFNRDTGVGDTSRIETNFLAGGSMIHHAPKGFARVQNTTISAIAVLASIQVRSRRVGITISRRKAAAGRDFTREETINLLQELHSKDQSVDVESRIVVYDNPDAAVLIPQEFPCGPYDERFGWRGDRPCRTYVGAELAAIEGEEEEVGIRQEDPLGLRA